jgi:hypothetical protein
MARCETEHDKIYHLTPFSRVSFRRVSGVVRGQNVRSEIHAEGKLFKRTLFRDSDRLQSL